MKIKITGGTVQHGQASLCGTCRHATIIRGTSLRHEFVDCGRLYGQNGRITFPVTTCTGYSDSRLPSIREMEEIAWILRTDAKRNSIGFVQAKKLKPRDRYVLDDDD
jgi:hypothetical protein